MPSEQPHECTREIIHAEKACARQWYVEHRAHVDAMVAECRLMYPPFGSVCANPALWRGPHWKWLLREIQDVE